MKALAVAAALAVGTAALPASVAPPSLGAAIRRPVAAQDDDHPLERARRVAHQIPFSGTVVVTWHDGAGAHREELQVHAAGGTVLVDGRADPVVETAGRQLARGRDGDWALLWGLEEGAPAEVPDPSQKYRTVTVLGAGLVAGRSTDRLELIDDGRPRARLELDRETGLLLRREHFNGSGAVERTVEFRHLTLDPSTAAPGPSPTVTARLASQASSMSGPTRIAVPAEVGDGYARLGVYRRGSVVQIHYSDGLYDLSVFEEPGDLDGDSLPGPGRRVRVGGEEGRLYAWPGGHVLVWQAGPVVRTVVSDAPSDEVVEAAQSLPGPGWGRPSLLDKIRRAGAALVDPIQ